MTSKRMTVIAIMILTALAVRPALAQTPSASPLVQQGDELYTQRGDLAKAKEARAKYEAALAAKEDNYGASWRRARVLYWIGDHTTTNDAKKPIFLQGIEHAKKAVELDPNPATRAASSLPEIDYVSRGPGRAPLRPALKEDQIVWARAPVRLDLAGGWTDTPPYTLRHGGRVMNLAVNLNGQPPIQVFCRRTAERHVRVHSIDLGHTETFTRFEELRDYREVPCPPSRSPRRPCA